MAFPPPINLSDPGIELVSPALQADFFLPLGHQGISCVRRWYLQKDFSFFNQFGSVSQSCLYFCAPIDCSIWDFLVHHQLPGNALTHVYRVGDAIQPSHSLLSPSPPAFNLSQLQGLFQSVSSLHQVAEVLELQLHHQSFQWIFRTDFLLDGLVWSLCCLRYSQESSPLSQF